LQLLIYFFLKAAIKFQADAAQHLSHSSHPQLRPYIFLLPEISGSYIGKKLSIICCDPFVQFSLILTSFMKRGANATTSKFTTTTQAM
jgi:hypothetical protein